METFSAVGLIQPGHSPGPEMINFPLFGIKFRKNNVKDLQCG